MRSYYADEYTAELAIYCDECDKEFDKEVDVKGNWVETTCPAGHQVEKEIL